MGKFKVGDIVYTVEADKQSTVCKDCDGKGFITGPLGDKQMCGGCMGSGKIKSKPVKKVEQRSVLSVQSGLFGEDSYYLNSPKRKWFPECRVFETRAEAERSKK